MKKTILILAIWANTLFSNDSFYTPTTDKQVIHHDEGYIRSLVYFTGSKVLFFDIIFALLFCRFNYLKYLIYL